MPAPTFLLAEWVAAFQRLMPRGRVWPRATDAIQTAAITALMPTYVRQAERAGNLLVDSFPATAREMLPEWESALGLPDPCIGATPTEARRQLLVVARLTGRGGQSVAYLTAYAAALGYTVTITEFAPFRAGLNTAGQPLRNADWAHHWQVNAPVVTTTYFRAGQSVAGEALRTWGNAELECELRRLAPAHTSLSFAYA